MWLYRRCVFCQLTTLDNVRISFIKANSYVYIPDLTLNVELSVALIAK